MKSKITIQILAAFIIPILAIGLFVLPKTASATNCTSRVAESSMGPLTLTSRTQKVTGTFTIAVDGCGADFTKVYVQVAKYRPDGTSTGFLAGSKTLERSTFKKYTYPSGGEYYAVDTTLTLTPFTSPGNDFPGSAVTLKTSIAIDDGPFVLHEGGAKTFTAPPPSPGTGTGGGGTGGGQTNGNTAPPRDPLNTSIGVNSNSDYDVVVGQFQNPLKVRSIPELIALLTRILLSLIAMVAVVVIIVAGFRMVAFGGNPEEVKKAKGAITWAIIGLIVALFSFSIVAILQRIIQR